jgi:maltokinase
VPELHAGLLPDEVLAEWVVAQRWFGAKAQSVSEVNVLEALPLPVDAPAMSLGLVEARFQAGTHELYQVPLALRPRGEGGERGVIAELDGWSVVDALADPEACVALVGLMAGAEPVDTARGRVELGWTGALPAPGPGARVRSVGVEQSNTSIVFDDRLILKAFRKVEPGDNPELEMLRFLSARGFPSIAVLGGWYELSGELLDATLGVLQRFVVGGRDGWELALDELAAGSDAFLGRLGELGAVTGRMHTVLASDATDPDFAPEAPSDELLSLLTATVDEQIERTFVDLPPGLDALEPIAGRGEEVRDRLQLLSHVGVGGRLIRTHGDYHLGQTLLAPEGWIILDFEGEPARPLLERRRKRSPLRDVAGMLRSFAYAASASLLLRGVPAPPDWEDAARAAFLDAYLEAVDPALLPAGQGATEKLLSIFELEKAVYELRYELNHRPDWVAIPAAGIHRLLEAPLT